MGTWFMSSPSDSAGALRKRRFETRETDGGLKSKRARAHTLPMSEPRAKYRAQGQKVVLVDFTRPLMLKPDPAPYRVTSSSSRTNQSPEPRSNVVKFPSSSERFK